MILMYLALVPINCHSNALISQRWKYAKLLALIFSVSSVFSVLATRNISSPFCRILSCWETSFRAVWSKLSALLGNSSRITAMAMDEKIICCEHRGSHASVRPCSHLTCLPSVIIPVVKIATTLAQDETGKVTAPTAQWFSRQEREEGFTLLLKLPLITVLRYSALFQKW